MALGLACLSSWATSAAAQPGEDAGETPETPAETEAAQPTEQAGVGESDGGDETAAQAPPAVAPEPEPEAESTGMDQASQEASLVEDAGLEGELTQAELAELGLTSADMGEKSTLLGDPFEIHGFADFSFLSWAVPKDSTWRGAANRHPTFWMGNFNLYLGKNLTRYLRTFAEVRFTLLPNGAPVPGSPSGDYISTAVADYADFGREIKWAGIEFERVYLEWVAHELLAFRLGIFLTPYGIWNVDHGSPTIITPTRPFVIGQALFPERQTGLEVFGRKEIGSDHSFGYHATLSNGDGPVSDYRDMDRNKALGGRVFWRYSRMGTLQVGGSAYYGWDTASNEVPSLTADGGIQYTETVASQSKVLALAADARWEWKGLLLQSELVTQQRRYTERGRLGANNPLAGEYLFPIDRLSWGVYGLVGYRFDWYGVMPYVVVEHTDMAVVNTNQLLLANSFSVGLNIRPIPVLVAKIHYNEGRFPKGFAIANDPSRLVQVQIAWAF